MGIGRIQKRIVAKPVVIPKMDRLSNVVLLVYVGDGPRSVRRKDAED